MADMYSSSESIPTLVVVVTGVGGAAGGVAAEARTFFWLGRSSLLAEVIVASAAFRFLVMGGIVTAGQQR
jgi:D-serine dehydratase